jgi:Leucine-rich repeat (LRR) protein
MAKPADAQPRAQPVDLEAARADAGEEKRAAREEKGHELEAVELAERAASPAQDEADMAGLPQTASFHQLLVVDGTLFGLPGNLIGPDGTVFDGSGQAVAFLEGYADQFGAQHAELAVATPAQVAEMHSLAVVEVEEEEEEEEADEGKLEAAVGGGDASVERSRLSSSQQRRNQRPIVEEDEESGAPSGSAAAAARGDGDGDDVLVEELVFEDGYVLQGGQVVGTLRDDGVVVALDGTELGCISDESRQVVAETMRAQRKLDEKEQLERLRYVPDYHPEMNVAGPQERASLGDDVQQAETWAPIQVAETLPQQAEPEEGMVPLGFKRDFFEKKKAMLPVRDRAPMRFTRPFLAPDFPAESKLMDVAAVAEALHPRGKFPVQNVRLLWVSGLDKALGGGQMGRLGRLLSNLVNLEVLGIFNSGLSQLEQLKLPKLLRLDVRHNRFNSNRSVAHLVEHTPRLQHLSIASNPLSDKWGAPLPPPKDSLWRTVIALEDLDTLNGQVLSTLTRAEATQRHGTKAQKRALPELLWSIALSRVDSVLQMAEWKPLELRELCVRGQGLETFSVAALRNLEVLDLAENRISGLESCGLHLCERLAYINLELNDLAPSDLLVFSLASGLRQLFLVGNKRLEKLGAAEYRHKVIFHTRFLCGSNRATGLLELDGKPVTIEERVRAIVSQTSGRQEDFHRWSLNLIALYGHAQLRNNVDFVRCVRNLAMPDRNLAAVDLRQFVGLEVVDLSKNRLERVQGVENLVQLRVLKVSNNPGLKLDALLHAMTRAPGGPLTRLEQVFVAPTPAKLTQKHIRLVLNALCFHNRRLAVIDGRIPSVEDRVQAYRVTLKANAQQAQLYRFHLGLLLSATPFEGRSYHPDDVGLQSAARQYNPKEVTALLRLSHLELTHQMLDFRPFERLEVLNLSHNGIQDLLLLGLGGLQHLRSLDVRSNRIDNKPEVLGPFFNGLPSLVTVALRGNPCMRLRGDRIRLLANIARMKEIQCTLRVIDEPITIDERVEAMKMAGADMSESEKLRYQVALFMRAPDPRKIPAMALRALNLEGMKLRLLRLEDYPNLEVLRLRKNELHHVQGLGLLCLSSLRLLDMRENQLGDAKEVMQLVNSLKAVEYLGFAGNPFSNGNEEDYRHRFIGSARQLRVVGCPLLWLDDRRIEVEEIVAGWMDTGGKKDECNRFRFDLHVHRRLEPGQHPQQLFELDLAGCGLTVLDLEQFTKLRRLSLADNALTWKALEAGGIGSLTELEELVLSNNNVAESDAEALGELCDKLPYLVSLFVDGNRACPDNAPKSRVQFLANVPNIDDQKLVLRRLNGVEVSVSERVDATQARDRKITREQLEMVRTVLTLEAVEATAESSVLALGGRQLWCLQTLSQFSRLTTLDLSNNNITTLTGQGIDKLPSLASLDLRDNKIESLGNALDALSGCNALKTLWLRGATADGSCAKVTDPEFTAAVGNRLLGLQMLDGQKLPNRLSDSQWSAQRFLWELARIGPNGLHNIDMTDFGIPGEYLWHMLSALRALRCVRRLSMQGNGWNQGKMAVENLRQIVVHALGESLKELNGERVTEEEQLAAIQFVKKQKELGSDMLRDWTECSGKALKRLEANPERPFKRAKSDATNNVNFFDVSIGGAGAGAGAAASAAGGAQQSSVAGARNEEVDEKGVPVQGVQGPPEIRGGAGNERGGGRGGAGAGGKGEEIKAAAKAGASAARGSIVRQGQVFMAISGNLITKFEILINFLQMYALVLILDTNIPWPPKFLDFSVWVRFFTVEIEFVWDMQVPFQQQLKFAVIMALPAMFFFFYTLLHKINKDKWIERYITNWEREKKKKLTLFFTLMVCVVLAGFLYDHPTSYRLVSSGKWPSPRTNGLIAVGFIALTSLLSLWWLVVNVFRSHRLNDHSANHTQFFEWWLHRIFMLRRLSLFMLTILFMPVARVILSQFQCFCNDAAGASSGVSDGGSNVGASASAGDAAPLRCHIKYFPEQRCLPDEYSVLQFVALFFGATYIVGIPVFFFVLIRNGVHQMVDIHGYKDEEERVNQRIAELKASGNTRATRREIEQLREDLHVFYFNKAVVNKTPQTYLYAPYRRRHRYFKIFNMFQKLLIVVVTLFVPNSFYANAKLLFSSCILGLGMLTSQFARPFSDGFENVLDLSAQFSNTITVLAAYALRSEVVGQILAETVLLMVNGGVLALFALAVLASPVLYCINAARERKAARIARQQAKGFARQFSADNIKRVQTLRKPE